MVYAYCGEFHDNRARPKAISWMSTSIALGNMFLPGLAWSILPGEWAFDIPGIQIAFRPWRLLMIAYTIPTIIFTIVFFCLPESPKYLIMMGRKDEALDILRTMYATNFKTNKESFPVGELTWDELGEIPPKQYGVFMSMWKQTAPLFKRDLARKTAMVCFLQFAIFLS